MRRRVEKPKIWIRCWYSEADRQEMDVSRSCNGELPFGKAYTPSMVYRRLRPDAPRLSRTPSLCHFRKPRLLTRAILIPIRLLVLPKFLPEPSSPRIELLPILIPHLPAALPSPILPAFTKALVQVTPYDPFIQLRAPDILQTIQRILVSIVLDETETARCLGEAIQTHDEAFELAGFGEEGVDLLFGGVKGEVADVEGAGVAELLFEVWGGGAVGIVAGGAAALFVLKGNVRSWLVGWCEVGVTLLIA